MLLGLNLCLNCSGMWFLDIITQYTLTSNIYLIKAYKQHSLHGVHLMISVKYAILVVIQYTYYFIISLFLVKDSKQSHKFKSSSPNISSADLLVETSLSLPIPLYPDHYQSSCQRHCTITQGVTGCHVMSRDLIRRITWSVISSSCSVSTWEKERLSYLLLSASMCVIVLYVTHYTTEIPGRASFSVIMCPLFNQWTLFYTSTLHPPLLLGRHDKL